MPQIKVYTANRTMQMDCGHSVKAGEIYQIFRTFTCVKNCTWPHRLLVACSEPASDETPHNGTPAPQPTPKRDASRS